MMVSVWLIKLPPHYWAASSTFKEEIALLYERCLGKLGLIIYRRFNNLLRSFKSVSYYTSLFSFREHFIAPSFLPLSNCFPRSRPRRPTAAFSRTRSTWNRLNTAHSRSNLRALFHVLLKARDFGVMVTQRFHGDGSHAEGTRGNPLRKLWNFHPLLCNRLHSTYRLWDMALLSN